MEANHKEPSRKQVILVAKTLGISTADPTLTTRIVKTVKTNVSQKYTDIDKQEHKKTFDF